MQRKSFIKSIIMILTSVYLSACSINPATGEKQFTALMPASQEIQIGKQEHPKILSNYGGATDNKTLQAYVRKIGQSLVPHTERHDVKYTFHLIDSPEVNAFAVPGGYIYVTRGLMVLAENEAQLAGVLAHEIGHITARHSAERYSQSVVTGLGAALLAAAIDKSGVSEAVSLGSELYLKSYSRSQEHQADELGVRYMTRAGYDPYAMSSFLIRLQKHTTLQAMVTGAQTKQGVDYFATHPQTEDRVAQASNHASTHHNGTSTKLGRDTYLQSINGVTFGDSPRQGYVRGDRFIHPQMDFMIKAPTGYKILNQSNRILILSPDKKIITVFDMAKNSSNKSAYSYVSDEWMKGQDLTDFETISMNGMRGATASFSGVISGKPSQIRVVAVQWSADQFARFQIAYPLNTDADVQKDLRAMMYSLRNLTSQEKIEYRPYKISIKTATERDRLDDFVRRSALDKYSKEWLILLNNIPKDESIQAGKKYKLIEN